MHPPALAGQRRAQHHGERALTDPELAQALHRAEQLRSAGNFTRALDEVRDILARFGEVQGAHEIAARCYLGARQYLEAIESAEAALRVFPTGLEARRILGIARLRAGKLKESVDAFDELIALGPELSHGYYWKGVALRLQGRPDDARAAFNEAITQKDDALFVEALSELALLDVAVLRFRQALSSARSAVEIEPENAVAHRALAICRYEAGRYDEALEALDDARRLAPESEWTAWLEARYRAAFGGLCSRYRGWMRAPLLVEGPWSLAAWLTVPLVALTLPVFGVALIVNGAHASVRYGRESAPIELDV